MPKIDRNADGRAYVRVSAKVADVLAGDDDPKDWDDEELFRGHPRRTDGSLSGGVPSIVPREVYDEFIRRQLERAEQGFAANVAKAVERLAVIATDPEVDPSIQLRAIGMMLDRVFGQPKASIEFTGVMDATPAWQATIEAVTVLRGEFDPPSDSDDEADNVEDAVLVEDEDDEEEEWEWDDD